MTGPGPPGPSGFPPLDSEWGLAGRCSSLGSTIETWSGKGFLGPILPLGSQGNIIFTLIPKNTLSQEDVSAGSIDVIVARITTVNHQTIYKLHRFGSLSSKFSRNNDFATFCT